jgi:hypothetical protein
MFIYTFYIDIDKNYTSGIPLSYGNCLIIKLIKKKYRKAAISFSLPVIFPGSYMYLINSYISLL